MGGGRRYDLTLKNGTKIQFKNISTIDPGKIGGQLQADYGDILRDEIQWFFSGKLEAQEIKDKIKKIIQQDSGLDGTAQQLLISKIDTFIIAQ